MEVTRARSPAHLLARANGKELCPPRACSKNESYLMRVSVCALESVFVQRAGVRENMRFLLFCERCLRGGNLARAAPPASVNNIPFDVRARVCEYSSRAAVGKVRERAARPFSELCVVSVYYNCRQRGDYIVESEIEG